MNKKAFKWGLVIPAGWFAIFMGAAIFLPPHPTRLALRTVPFLALTVAWLLLTAIALFLYFYRAWLRLRPVPNKAAYAVWLSFEIACTLAFAVMLVSLFVPSYVTSPRQAREWALEQNLHVMRAVIGQYTLDLQKRPQSLDDLVKAGYIKQRPTDPITRRNDTWDLEWSNDPKMPGIVNIRSGSIATNSKGSAYQDW